MDKLLYMNNSTGRGVDRVSVFTFQRTKCGSFGSVQLILNGHKDRVNCVKWIPQPEFGKCAHNCTVQTNVIFHIVIIQNGLCVGMQIT